MNTALIVHLRSIGVVLSLDADGRLAFDSPADALTDELMTKMRTHRDELFPLVAQEVERTAIVEPLVVDGECAYLEPMCGVMCPWCRSNFHLVEHDSCLRCDNCNRKAWRFEDRAMVRCDWNEPSVIELPIVPSGDRTPHPNRCKSTTIDRAKGGQSELAFRS